MKIYSKIMLKPMRRIKTPKLYFLISTGLQNYLVNEI